MESEGKDEEYPSRMKPSHGRKKLYQAIQERMEFYFSDANLSKDRFMTNLLENSHEIDISVFLKFNKIRELTDNVQDIVKALKKSSLLSVTEDGTKVYRTVPVKVKENVDECTIYVEQLPLDAGHDWLKGIFSQYGKVDYVSVPKFKHSGKIKGFAFIEFETPEGAMNALDAFTKAGCKLPSTILPNQLCSIATFDRREKDVIKHNRIFGLSNEGNRNEAETKCEKKKSTEVKTEEPGKKNSRKRPHDSDSSVPKKIARSETSEEENLSEKESRKSKKRGKTEIKTKLSDGAEEEGLSSRKKQKASDESNIPNKDEVESDTSETKTSQIGDSASESCEQEGVDNSEAGRKKRRKKKKKHKKTKSDVASSGLQVLAKCEWKKLRNKYLELQRSKMNSLKQYLAKIKDVDSQHIIKMDSSENELPEGAATERSIKDITSNPRVQFTPGVILKLDFDEPIVDVKAFKNDVKSHEGVEYVDVKEGDFIAFVRCSDNNIAKQLNSEKLTNSAILKDDEEKNYWEKILKDREKKLTDKSLRTNQKGRTKLLKKAEKALGKRIRFDSD